MYEDYIDSMHHRAEALAQPLRGTAYFLVEHGERCWQFQMDAVERYQGVMLQRLREALDGRATGSSVLAELAHHWLEDSHRLVALGRQFQASAESLMREGPVVPLRSPWAPGGA